MNPIILNKIHKTLFADIGSKNIKNNPIKCPRDIIEYNSIFAHCCLISGKYLSTIKIPELILNTHNIPTTFIVNLSAINVIIIQNMDSVFKDVNNIRTFSISSIRS